MAAPPMKPDPASNVALCTLNSSTTPGGGEYAICAESYGWGDDDLREITRTALEAAFCEDTLKEELMRKV